jgi:ribonucleoside-diphosphate reductase alpha chain
LKEEHLSIFDCAFKAKNGKRFIHYKGHVEMMAATQPFLSGAISKTVNLPHDATPEDIRNAYIQGWQKGLKAVAIYRDGSKRTQPLNTSLDERAKDDDAKTIEYVLKAYDLCEKLGLSLDLPRAVYEKKRSVLEGKLNESSPVVERAGPVRRPMPKKRNSYTEKFSISGHEGYYTVGLFDDGTPGEVFVTMAKEGGTIGGLMGQLGTSWSMNLQYGVPLSVILKKMIGSKFDPSGWTEGEDDKDLKAVSSITDYLGKKLKKTFLTGDDGEILDVPRPYYGGLVRSVPTLDSKVKAIKTVATPSLALSTKDDRFLPEYHVLDKYCTNCQNETIYKTDDNCGTICSTCSTIGREGCGG